MDNAAYWEEFLETGEIDAYLLYKGTDNFEKTKDDDAQWQTLKQKALS